MQSLFSEFVKIRSNASALSLKRTTYSTHNFKWSNSGTTASDATTCFPLVRSPTSAQMRRHFQLPSREQEARRRRREMRKHCSHCASSEGKGMSANLMLASFSSVLGSSQAGGGACCHFFPFGLRVGCAERTQNRHAMLLVQTTGGWNARQALD